MPRTAKPYRLVPAEVPPLAGRRAGLYAEIVADFVASGVESALVEMPGRKANSLNVGLRKAVDDVRREGQGRHARRTGVPASARR